MTTFSLRAILLTTALLTAPAWAQDQALSSSTKSDAAKPDGGTAAQADKKTDADAQPLVIDASRPVKVAAKGDNATTEPVVIDASKGVKMAQENQVPATQDSTDGRAIPGPLRNYERPVLQNNEGAVQAPPPEAFPDEWIPVPDRWRIVDALGIGGQWWDPYNQNVIKGDRPILGTNDWFMDLTGVSDSVAEIRSFPTPVGVQTTQNPGSLDVFGNANSQLYTQTFIAGADIYQGSTAFKPPDLEFRFAAAANINYAMVSERRILNVDPSKPPHRLDGIVALQEAFMDYHIRNVDDRYDFDSIRIGIQPFTSDFRGFLFQYNQLGVRLFGDRENNRYQYNLGFFARLEKDTNSGLNDITQMIRNDYLAVANFYAQDFPVPGFTSEAIAVYNWNREGNQIHLDENGFPARPALLGDNRGRDYDVVYLGYSGDGHIGDVNLTVTGYGELGQDRNSIFTNVPADISGYFFAAEPSMDFDWIRVRLSGLYASGDNNPYDNHEGGFDAIFENPQFAGADTSYWIRQSIPFAGGGRDIFLNSRNGVLNDLRPSKEEGQSNFNNPGTILLGAGADFDVLPELRVSSSLNHLWFADTTIVEALRQQGNISQDLGWDASMALTWRPFLTQNIVLRASGAVLSPGAGFNDLFTTNTHDGQYYSVLLNAIATF
ncbi:MAG TPA: hypothetical protein VHY57_01515 [Rhizomicrobium sp.]|nr:hypothetical protein [Rhizomicrobium sp.]